MLNELNKTQNDFFIFHLSKLGVSDLHKEDKTRRGHIDASMSLDFMKWKTFYFIFFFFSSVVHLERKIHRLPSFTHSSLTNCSIPQLIKPSL